MKLKQFLTLFSIIHLPLNMMLKRGIESYNLFKERCADHLYTNYEQKNGDRLSGETVVLKQRRFLSFILPVRGFSHIFLKNYLK